VHHIFVGSSTEALQLARHVCEILSSDKVKADLWTDIFEPGYLTFEALEKMLHQCCAAVFIASADDLTNVRDKLVKLPRANIMLEFGLVAGRLGHHSVAVCQYDCAELPSDLAGLTVIRMEPPVDHPDPDQFRKEAIDKLNIWSSRLLNTASGIPRTDVVHGYSGRWDFEITLQTWRDLPIVSPSYAHVRGYLDLFLLASGQVGRGLAHGFLQFKLWNSDPKSGVFHGEYRTAHEIRNAVGGKDGTLDLTTEAFALQKVETAGTAPLQLVGMETFPEPWSAHWQLAPSADRTLTGTVRSQGSITTQGLVTAMKRES
jgi:hypothetical protein